MMQRLLLAALLLALALALAAPPPPYTANSEVLRNGDRLGKATVVFKALPNGRYELTSSTVGSEGLAAIAGVAIDERSILRWTGEQPETMVYSYRQQMAWKTRERSIEVDAGNRRIDSKDKDRRFSPPYQPGVLDRNAITVALMGDVAAGRTGDLEYLVPSKDELETQVYRVAPPERLNTALGAQRVVRVERIRGTANGRTTTLWLGQDKNFVPLRILQKEPDSETIEMRITSIR
jgi:hypothetical protein